MASLDFMTQRLTSLQEGFDTASAREQEDWPGEVYAIGLQSFGACQSEADIKQCCGLLVDLSLRAAFIKGLNDQVTSPAYKDSPKAQMLRPFVTQTYQELHA